MPILLEFPGENDPARLSENDRSEIRDQLAETMTALAAEALAMTSAKGLPVAMRRATSG